VLTLMQMVNVDLMRSTQGVSTGRVKEVTTELCGREFSKSTVSHLSKDLEEQVQAWASRPLGQEYPFLMLGCPCNSKSGGRRPSGPGDRHAGGWHQRGRSAGDSRA
jgi:hypothetical protein